MSQLGKALSRYSRPLRVRWYFKWKKCLIVNINLKLSEYTSKKIIGIVIYRL